VLRLYMTRLGHVDYLCGVTPELLASLGLEVVDGGFSFFDGRDFYLYYNDFMQLFDRYSRLGLAVPPIVIAEKDSDDAAALAGMRQIRLEVPLAARDIQEIDSSLEIDSSPEPEEVQEAEEAQDEPWDEAPAGDELSHEPSASQGEYDCPDCDTPNYVCRHCDRTYCPTCNPTGCAGIFGA
jgi:hypothetical protein